MTLHTHELLARYLRDYLERAFSEEAEFGRVAVQGVVWIVSLAAALMTLLLANWGEVTVLSASMARIVFGMLGGVIVLGVVQRAAQYLGERALRVLEKDVAGRLMAMLDDSNLPTPLREWWNQETIVARLRDNFGLDYTFLVAGEASLEETQEIYLKQYELWEKYDVEGLKDLGRLIGAIDGRGGEESEAIFLPRPADGDGLDETRAKGADVRKYVVLANALFLVGSLLFISTVILVVFAVIGAP